MSMQTTDYLIIGNCAAGVTAAETLRAADSQAAILMVSDEPYAAYGRPLISYLIEGATDEASINLRPEGFYEENRLDTLFGPDYAVVSLDADAHEVRMAGGQVVRYGKCLIATGSTPFVPETAGLANQENVFTFTTLDQAKAVRSCAQAATQRAHEQGRVSRAMVSGAGLVGLKAAEALSFLVDEVVVVGRAPFILRAVLDPAAGGFLQQRLEPHGVRCLTGVTASSYQSQDGRITGATLSDGTTLECDLLVMAAGVRPNCGFAVEAGAQAGRGLTVDACQQTSLPDVFAAGDVCQVENLLDGSVGPLAQWPNAVRQARVAALCMAGASAERCARGNFAVNSTNFFDTSVLTCGMTNPSPELGYQSIVHADDSHFAKFVTKDDRLYGYVLLNAPDNAGIYTQLITKAMPLSSLPKDIFDRPMANIEFPEPMRFKRLHMGCPAGVCGA